MTPRNPSPPLALGLSALLILLFLSALALPALLPHGGLPEPLVFVLLVLLAVAASQHRPFGGGLSLGSLVLPVALERLGGWPTALLAALGLAAADLLRRWLVRHFMPKLREERRLLRSLEGALATSSGVLAAALLWPRAADDSVLLPRILAAGLLFLATTSLLRLAYQQFWRPSTWTASLAKACRPALTEGAGWLLGSLALGAQAGSWRLAILAGLALLAAEAGRHNFLRGVSERRAGSLRRMHDAHRRILGEISGPGGIAQQILVECRNVLPVHFYQFVMPALDGGDQIWSAGPEGSLAQGSPEPSPNPPALPGIHRRATWHRIIKELRVEGETLATLSLWCDPRLLEPGAEELFESLGPQMASSVHRARLDREARLDSLTQLPVRRVLEQRLQKVYRACCQEGSSMAVIMCDIDHFKAVNDTHGHGAGDDALVLVARTLDQERRRQDICCRYGGEEFTLLLENTAGDQAFQIAERLRQAVEALELVYEGTAIPLRLSCGVAAFPELHVKTGSELQLLADEALYTAKNEGRNRSMLHLGKGSFRDARGWMIEPEGEQPHTPPPRIFD